MHHIVLEGWSRRDSALHRRDPRAKLIALLGFLIAVALTSTLRWPAFAAYAALLLAMAALARLPVVALLTRAAIVLPFAAVFGLVTALSGDPERAALLALKSYLSALGALLLMGTTPLPVLLDGVLALGAPRLLVLVIQFLYRYLFVVSEQAQHMRMSARSRGGAGSVLSGRRRGTLFRAATGMVAVLFGRSHARAEAIHRAMLARGFEGRLPTFHALRFEWPDGVCALGFCLAALAIRALLGGTQG